MRKESLSARKRTFMTKAVEGLQTGEKDQTTVELTKIVEMEAESCPRESR